jgi:hypothetical protein
MNRSDFLKKYPGKLTLAEFERAALAEKRIDWDGAYGEQCVDLFRFYCHCVLGMGKQPAGVIGAKDFFLNYKKDPVLIEHFMRIENTPDFVPKPGDVDIWDSTPLNPFGHISIEIGPSTTKTLMSLDQNVIKNTITKQRHGYNNFLGVLRPKQNIKG